MQETARSVTAPQISTWLSCTATYHNGFYKGVQLFETMKGSLQMQMDLRRKIRLFPDRTGGGFRVTSTYIK